MSLNIKALYNKTNITKRFPHWVKPNHLWIACYCLLGFLIFASHFREPSHNIPSNSQTLDSADTYIPFGYVLVPIQLQNHQSLDSLLGPYGVVDLYTTSEDPNFKPKKLADQVKIIRAPLNPKQFAVLVPEAESPELVKYAGPVMATLQNPKKANTKILKEKKQTSRITIESYGG